MPQKICSGNWHNAKILIKMCCCLVACSEKISHDVTFPQNFNSSVLIYGKNVIASKKCCGNVTITAKNITFSLGRL
jgi:hypothetical protein